MLQLQPLPMGLPRAAARGLCPPELEGAEFQLPPKAPALKAKVAGNFCVYKKLLSQSIFPGTSWVCCLSAAHLPVWLLGQVCVGA